MAMWGGSAAEPALAHAYPGCRFTHSHTSAHNRYTPAQVSKAERVGDKVVLTVEPVKGGPAETMEVDVCLVSAGKHRV